MFVIICWQGEREWLLQKKINTIQFQTAMTFYSQKFALLKLTDLLVSFF